MDSMKPKASKKPLIFLGIGIGNALFDFCFYTLLTQTVFKSHDQIALAGIVSGTAALLFAFTTHSLVTWRGSNINHATLLRFVFFTGFGMWAIRPLLLASFIKLSGLYLWAYGASQNLHLPFTQDFIASTGAFGFMIAVLLIYNFLVYDRFVFNKMPMPIAKDEATSSEASPGLDER